MAKLVITFRYIVLCATLCLLSGCLGGTIAQQVIRTIATKVADKAMAHAMDVEDGPSNRQATSLKDTPPDPYKTAFVNSAFEPVHAIEEPLPSEVAEVETPIQVLQGSQLVRVELFNLLIGDEKNAVYENARLMGATSLPQKREWQNWTVGTGQIKSSTNQTSVDKNKEMITFLIPPEFGKLPSGTLAVVELAGPGELNVVRYKANENTPVIKMPAIKTLANR
jgi:hypothetical protein